MRGIVLLIGEGRGKKSFIDRVDKITAFAAYAAHGVPLVACHLRIAGDDGK